MTATQDLYARFFGFREPPFAITPDPRFLYVNPTYHEAYASLLLGVTAGKGFVVLTGEVGTGKTTLLQRLMTDLDHPLVFIHNPMLGFDELLALMCYELNVKPAAADRLNRLMALNEYLIKQAEGGRIVGVLIDEAQHLPDRVLEELRLLSNLETSTQKLLQIVLVGQPELEAKLDQPGLRQLKQRVWLRCRLLPLSRADADAYISHRLRAAGYRGPRLFTADALRRIYKHSGGIPRLVNILCDNALLIAYALSERRVTGEMVMEAAQDLHLGPQPSTAEARQHARQAPWSQRSRLEAVHAARARRARNRWAVVVGVALVGALAMLAWPNIPGLDRMIAPGVRGSGPESSRPASPAAAHLSPQAGEPVAIQADRAGGS